MYYFVFLFTVWFFKTDWTMHTWIQVVQWLEGWQFKTLSLVGSIGVSIWMTVEFSWSWEGLVGADWLPKLRSVLSPPVWIWLEWIMGLMVTCFDLRERPSMCASIQKVHISVVSTWSSFLRVWMQAICDVTKGTNAILALLYPFWKTIWQFYVFIY